MWDASNGNLLLTLRHEGLVNGAVWNEAAGQILSWGCSESSESGNCIQGTAQVWEVRSGNLLLTLRHEGLVNGAVWNEAESQILSRSDDGTARVWDATSGELLFTLVGDGSPVEVARWNQDESRLLLATENGFIRVYYTHTAELAGQACQYATRNFTWQEWQLYFPGQPYQQTCADLPVHPSVPENARP